MRLTKVRRRDYCWWIRNRRNYIEADEELEDEDNLLFEDVADEDDEDLLIFDNDLAEDNILSDEDIIDEE